MKKTKTIFLFVILIAAIKDKAIAQSNIISTFAGTGVAGWSGDGGAATIANISGPNTLMVDPLGNVFISDASNNRVRMVNTSGVITEIAGNGFAGWAGDGGPATAAEFSNPSGFAMDRAGNFYVADQYNHVVRKINTAGIITTIAGSHGVSGFSGDGGPATAAKFDRPYGLSFDSFGNLYIIDQYNHALRKIIAHADTISLSDTITTFAGHGSVSGSTGDGGPATDAYLYYPGCIYIDAYNNVLISDNGNQKIRKVNTSNIITTIAGSGTIGWSGDGGPATDAALDYPTGVKMDTFGNIIFEDGAGNRIRKINSSGIISTICGIGAAGFGGDAGPATAAVINEPLDIAIDHSNNILIADYLNNRVRIILAGCSLPLIDSITGPNSVCTEQRLTLSDSISGGTWSSNNTVVATVGSANGIVTCVGAGIAIITYSITNSCGTTLATYTITVNPYVGMTTGTDSLCPGDTVTLYNTVNAGAWSSVNASIASITNFGLVTGVKPGLDTIRYIINTACGADTANFPITVNDCTNSVINTNVKTSASLSVFPNPNQGSFSIFISSPLTQTAPMFLTNIYGEKIKEVWITTNRKYDAAIPLAAGVYFLSVAVSNQNFITKMIIE